MAKWLELLTVDRSCSIAVLGSVPATSAYFFGIFRKILSGRGEGFMRKRRERVCSISKHLCFPRFENINVLEALAKQRCIPIGKQNVYQWSASLLESRGNCRH